MPDYSLNRAFGSGFHDQDSVRLFRHAPPNIILKAAAVAAGGWDLMQGDDFQPGMVRNVIYEDSLQNKWEHEMVLYKHPIGAADVILGVRTGVVFVSSVKSELLLEVGTIATTRDNCKDIAGQLLSHYTETNGAFGNSASLTEPYWATVLEAGDYIWLIRNGEVELLADDAVLAGQKLVTENGNGSVDGAVDHSAGAITTLAEIEEEIAGPTGKCVGIALENGAAAAHFRALLTLGKRIL